MTQDECLATPSHWTHYGVCYEGSNATIQLHGITMGGAPSPSHSVPEPGTFALFAIAAAVAFMFNRLPRCRYPLG